MECRIRALGHCSASATRCKYSINGVAHTWRISAVRRMQWDIWALGHSGGIPQQSKKCGITCGYRSWASPSAFRFGSAARTRVDTCSGLLLSRLGLFCLQVMGQPVSNMIFKNKPNFTPCLQLCSCMDEAYRASWIAAIDDILGSLLSLSLFSPTARSLRQSMCYNYRMALTMGASFNNPGPTLKL